MTVEDIKKFIAFADTTSLDEFEEIFPYNTYKHIWNEFDKNYRGNMIKFFQYLDDYNKESLIHFIDRC